VLVLAIGIGANSAMFSLVDAALVRPSLSPSLNGSSCSGNARPVSPAIESHPELPRLERATACLRSDGGIAGGGRTLTGTIGTAERIPGQAVTPRFFETLGVRAIAGQTFDRSRSPASERRGDQREALAHAVRGEPTLVAARVALDGQPYTVIGVVPAGFQILFPADLWTPFVPRRSPEQRRQHYLQVVGD